MSPRWRWTTGAPIPVEAFLEEALWAGFEGSPLPGIPEHLVDRITLDEVHLAWRDGNLAREQRGPVRPNTRPPWMDRLA
jgi:hypothetical protein